jgi:hypothetical protein
MSVKNSQNKKSIVETAREKRTERLRRLLFSVSFALAGTVLLMNSFAATVSVKPPMQGLVDRQGRPPLAFEDVVNTYVLKVNWQDLQPTQNGPIASGNAIDTELAYVRQRNAAKPNLHMHLKLRVYAGIYAPDWAKNLSGSPVQIYDESTGQLAGTAGRFWEPSFGNAYRDFHAKLAAKYDSASEITEVTIARCTTIYAEPMIRQIGSQQTRNNLLAAGYTIDKDKTCQHEQVDVHADYWSQTRSSYAFNPYQQIFADGSANGDAGFATEMMDYCRQRLGRRCTLENNSISWPLKSTSNAKYGTVYDHMGQLGPPITFQTETPEKIGDWRQTLQWAGDFGANAVELNVRYTQDYPLSELVTYDTKLESNPTGDPMSQPPAPPAVPPSSGGTATDSPDTPTSVNTDTPIQAGQSGNTTTTTARPAAGETATQPPVKELFNIMTQPEHISTNLQLHPTKTIVALGLFAIFTIASIAGVWMMIAKRTAIGLVLRSNRLFTLWHH